MNIDGICEVSARLDRVARACAEDFGPELERFRRLNGIETPTKLREALVAVEETGRCLQVGIIGRVKAGKSSLINALVFDGDPILPKAATPMTAALTTISWGETFSAEVEFFSAGDLAALAEGARTYRHDLDACIQRHLGDLSKGAGEDPTKLRERATRKAQNEMNAHPDAAAFDQHERIRASGLDLEALEHRGRIGARNAQDLAAQLQDFVGAAGPFMPFTKAVHVFMPSPSLEGIRIIDTPGLNDPVHSREARTTELLKTCDVVFIVSPAVQFLTEQDQELMGRLTSREGVREIILVASQIDTLLFSPGTCPSLSDTLDTILAQIRSRAKTVLVQLDKDFDGGGGVFHDLTSDLDRGLLHSSGVSYGLMRRLERRESWDENERHVWGKLVKSYPDFFPEEGMETTRRSLALVANIESLRAVLERVRCRKEAIVRSRIDTLLSDKAAGLRKYGEEIKTQAHLRISEIETTSGQDLEQQRKGLEDKAAELQFNLDRVYRGISSDFDRGLRRRLRDACTTLFSNTRTGVDDAHSTVMKSETRDRSGAGAWFARQLWGGGRETISFEEVKLNTPRANAAIVAVLTRAKGDLAEMANDGKLQFDRDLAAIMVPEIYKIVGDEISVKIVGPAVETAVGTVPCPEFDLGIEVPADLSARGTLRGSKAEKYLDDAENFVTHLEGEALRKVEAFMDDVEAALPGKFSDLVIDELRGKIERLRSQIEHSAQAVDHLRRQIASVDEVAS